MGLWKMLKGEQPGIIDSLLKYENKGQWGEFSTEFALTNKNLGGEMVVLKNLYVPYNEITTEIDLLLIHEKGLFVFESKNYSGWIFGDTEQLNWTQTLRNGEKYKFYNPIRQNRSHIKALSQFLNIPESQFTSYIVFSERCSLMDVPENTSSVVIVRRPNMLKELRKSLTARSVCFSHSDIERISNSLRSLTNKDSAEKQQHVHNKKTKCPFCGSELVLRNGKYGQFWGCTTYPRCKYTRTQK